MKLNKIFLFIITLVLIFVPVGFGQGKITGSTTLGAKITKIPVQNFEMINIVGDRNVKLGFLALDGTKNKISLDVKSIKARIDLDDASGQITADLKLFSAGVVQEKGTDRHYVFIEGKAGRNRVRLELDFTPGFSAITGSTAIKPNKINKTDYHIILFDGNGKVKWKTTNALKDNLIQHNLSSAWWKMPKQVPLDIFKRYPNSKQPRKDELFEDYLLQRRMLTPDSTRQVKQWYLKEAAKIHIPLVADEMEEPIGSRSSASKRYGIKSTPYNLLYFVNKSKEMTTKDKPSILVRIRKHSGETEIIYQATYIPEKYKKKKKKKE